MQEMPASSSVWKYLRFLHQTEIDLALVETRKAFVVRHQANSWLHFQGCQSPFPNIRFNSTQSTGVIP